MDARSPALTEIRQELERMCRWRRTAPFSPFEQERWDLLGRREKSLIDELTEARAGSLPAP